MQLRAREHTRFKTLVVLVCLTALSSCGATLEGEALLSLMRSWKVEFSSWLPGTDPCKNWEGVKCSEQSQVTSLNLTNTGLTGPIPAEISVLVHLKVLDLSNNVSQSLNHVSGDLSAIEGLKELQALNLSFINLNSQFPTVVLQLTNLIDLRIDNCNLKGPFPLGLSNLINLEYLYLGNNSMTGDLPSQLGSLVNMVELSLWNNPFDSLIPVELKNLAHLTYLNLHDCGLWGGLPPEFENLKSIKKLHLYRNPLTGPIPENWHGLTNLQELKLEFDYLSGHIPSWLLSAPSLVLLALEHNQLGGSIPVFNNSHLKSLRVDCNYLTGDWPTNPRNITFLFGGNCFSNITAANDDTGSFCGREGTCAGFIKNALDHGDCPFCPGTQVLLNSTLCICGQESVQTAITPGESSSSRVGVIVGSTIASTCVAVLIGLYILMKCKNSGDNRQSRFFSIRDIDEYWEAPKGVHRYILEDLARATRNFHKEHEIGSGGFGKVFYGTLDDGKMVAIKRASSSIGQSSTQFRNEVALLSRLHHRNLVRLEGFCEEAGYQILVYEYVLNGNLHTRLFSNRGGRPLSWYKRLEIASGVAQALEYLHSFADPPVIHRDLKPSNILLDETLIAKVADFGLSRANAELNTHVSTKAAGTVGYMDPQYVLREQLTTGSDVYAFGVVLLELVTGQKSIDHARMEDILLVDWARGRLDTDGIKGIADPLLGDDYPMEVYEDMAMLALQCASFNKEDRPSIKTIVNILGNHLQDALPHLQGLPPFHMPSADQDDPMVDSVSTYTGTSNEFTNSSVERHSESEISLVSLCRKAP